MDAKQRSMVALRPNRHQGRSRRGPTPPLDRGGKLCHGWRLKENGQRKVMAELLFEAREQAYCQQRMTAKRKEIILDPDGPNIQNLFPDPHELTFQAVPPRRPPPRLFRTRLTTDERLAVDLPM